ncbi:MAG: glycosyltransferase [Sedimentisphaerales bacterium]|nr:glycosyltransferase [Sedimentisphaerales bacterium]
MSKTRVSIVTCVNDNDKYESCARESLAESCQNESAELIAVDNTGNLLSAPRALNDGLKRARANIVVCCHQDVIFPPNWVENLLEQITVIEQTQKNWGVLGTFGVAENGMFAGHIIDVHGHFWCEPLPAEVQSLDEHCLIMRKDSGLNFDENLGGFHLYGADLCLEALSKGMSNFAIDAPVKHLSGGKVDADFFETADRLYKKWKQLNTPLPVIQTTCKMIRLQSGLKGLISYRIARIKRKRRRKKVKKLLQAGYDYTTLRHDSI